MKPAASQESALHEIVTALRETAGAVTSSLDVAHQPDTDRSESEATGPRCVFCQLAERSTQRALRTFFAEFVNDPQVRARFRKSRGFCREHTPLLATCGDALGVAILYADLAGEAGQRWRSGAGNRRQTLLSRWFAANEKDACPACDAEAEAESRYTAAFAQALGRDESLWDLLRATEGLCVRHVEQSAAAAAPLDAARLLEIEAAKMDALFTELEEFVRKNDYRFRGEPWGAERDAWRRALQRLRRI